ncbi:MAG: hypothetical protein IKX52_03925, partial [Clostridia bacterium]|nr:hypothetical protein [Clostridia bacterium]
MTFDVYFPFTDANGVTKPGIKPHASKWEDIRDWLESDKVHIQSVTAVRQAATKKERDELKKKVRAVTPCGRTSSQRRNDFMSPTGLFMVDIDHVENALEKGKDALRELIDTMGDEWVRDNVYLFHVTVSGKGWRFFMKWQAVYQTLEDNMTWFYETFNFSRTGDFDAPCKDFSRLSFLPLAEDIIYESPHMCDENMDLLTDCPLVNDSTAVSITVRKGGKQGELFSEAEQVGEFTEAEVQKFENYEYKGHLVKEIVAKWIEHRGEPGEG